MRLAISLALVASLASLGAEPDEAISFDAPFAVVVEDRIIDFPDGGTVLTPEAFTKVDQEFVRLQRVEEIHATEPSHFGWFLAGGITGAIVATVLLGSLWLVTR